MTDKCREAFEKCFSKDDVWTFQTLRVFQLGWNAAHDHLAETIQEHIDTVSKNIDEFETGKNSRKLQDEHDASDYGMLHPYPKNCQAMNIKDLWEFIIKDKVKL